MRSFVDTNIWVYALDPRDPAKQRAAIELIRRDPSTIVVSPQVMGELYVTLTRLGSPAAPAGDAARAVDALRRFTVVPIEADHVVAAVGLTRRHSISYWDALIVATAGGAGCDRLFTEDLTDGSLIAGVRVVNPFLDPGRRVSESRAAYEPTVARTWDDQALRAALDRYREVCVAAGMRGSAVHSYWDYARRFLDWRSGVYPRHAVSRPAPDRAVDLDALRADAHAYRASCEAAGLGRATLDTYERHAQFFVRWLAGDFEPGARLRQTKLGGVRK